MATRNLPRIAVFSLALMLLLAAGCGGKGRDRGAEEVPDLIGPEEVLQDPGESIGDEPGSRRKPIEFAGFNQDGRLYTVYFDFDRSAIRSDQVDQLIENAKYLLDNPSFNVLIEGHCDERGTTEYNIALGERRAREARDFLISRGVNASRVEIISKGEEEPAVPGSTEEAYALNRRAEFLLTE